MGLVGEDMEEPQQRPANAAQQEKQRSDEERVWELVQQVRRYLANEDRESALALFHQLHPVDQGEVLVELAREPQQELLTALPPEETAKILEHLEPDEAVEVSESIEAPTLSHILDETSPDVAADILRHLPEERAQEVLQAMHEAPEVSPLLQYPDDSAGGVMTPGYPAVRDERTAANALDLLRLQGPRAENINPVFVVDSQGRLVGSLGITRLALARPTILVRDLMDPHALSVPAETDQEECARLMKRYSLGQLPVVNGEGQLIGVIRSEDVVGVVEQEATEDMYRMAGIAGERVFGPLRSSVRHRLPWLYVNLATAFLAASVINLFESTIARVVTLAVFLPVVAGQGGIGGTQTITLVVRSMALGELPGRRGLPLLGRELALGLVHGLLLGLVVGLVAYLWKGNFLLGVVLGLALMGNMLIGGLTGAGVPLLLRRLGIDPAVASAVFVTTFTDVMGFLFFLGLATALISFLL